MLCLHSKYAARAQGLKSTLLGKDRRGFEGLICMYRFWDPGKSFSVPGKTGPNPPDRGTPVSAIGISVMYLLRREGRRRESGNDTTDEGQGVQDSSCFPDFLV